MLIASIIFYFTLNHVFITPGSLSIIHGPQEIDNFFYNLQPDLRKLLTFHFDSDHKPVTEGSLDEDGNFVVLDRQNALSEIRHDVIEFPASARNHIFPGALLRANSHIQGSPDVYAFDRNPMPYTVDLSNLYNGFKIKPSFSNYKEKLDELLDRWQKSGKKTSISFEKQIEYIYSKEHLRAVFGKEIENSDIEEDINFEDESGQTVLVSRLKYTFFVASVEQSMRPSELFGPETTIEQLRQEIDENNPPVLVDQVRKNVSQILKSALKKTYSTLFFLYTIKNAHTLEKET